ncbi:DUF3850 domain-containing protein [Tateyamaria sp.]|uniref:DUF3850 domain-containing protein n=1 Tax=Tateyamaria sp. TaxID=1929288 RepID=UPI0039B8ABEA
MTILILFRSLRKNRPKKTILRKELMLEKQPTHFEMVDNVTDRGSVTHVLKCWPEFFEAIADGRKKHDLRRSTDRDLRVGDQLHLMEFDPSNGCYTGRSQAVWVTYVTSADLPCALSGEALSQDFCILSISADPPV